MSIVTGILSNHKYSYLIDNHTKTHEPLCRVLYYGDVLLARVLYRCSSSSTTYPKTMLGLRIAHII